MIATDVMNAATADLVVEPVDPAHVVDGSPKTGETVLSMLGGSEVGVWEMTAGAMCDTEVAEVSVVVAGSASIQFVHDGRILEVGPGDIIRFDGGERTIWRVSDRIRKVYVVEAG